MLFRSFPLQHQDTWRLQVASSKARGGDSLPGWEGWGSVALADCGLGVEEECGPRGGGGTGTRLGWAAGDLRVGQLQAGRPRLPHHSSHATAGRVPAVCPLRLVLSASGSSCAVSTQAWKPPTASRYKGADCPVGLQAPTLRRGPGQGRLPGGRALHCCSPGTPSLSQWLRFCSRGAVVKPVAAFLRAAGISVRTHCPDLVRGFGAALSWVGR